MESCYEVTTGLLLVRVRDFCSQFSAAEQLQHEDLLKKETPFEAQRLASLSANWKRMLHTWSGQAARLESLS